MVSVHYLGVQRGYGGPICFPFVYFYIKSLSHTKGKLSYGDPLFRSPSWGDGDRAIGFSDPCKRILPLQSKILKFLYE